MASLRFKNDYRVGIITALAIERAAVTAMLDDRHFAPSDFVQHPQDSNSYTWGSMGSHNIVMASLSTGVYGITSATTTVLPMMYAFPNIKWGLMVGIGAGVPSHGRDIRLGDVAVSQPMSSSGGVFQYDLWKLIGESEWKRFDWLARPPDILLKALGNLQAEHEFKGSSRAQQHLLDALNRHPEWAKSFSLPPTETDRLFEPSYSHSIPNKSCVTCDPIRLVHRATRETSAFQIHYGVIASGNSLVKHASIREKILQMEDQCICIEMEAAGLMNSFPCLVIRGICDYADTHKNDTWQRYASATAAAFAKELLTFTSEVRSTIEHRNLPASVLSYNPVPQTIKKALKIQGEALAPGNTTTTDSTTPEAFWRSTTSLSSASSIYYQALTSQKDSELQKSDTVVRSTLCNSSKDSTTGDDRLLRRRDASLNLRKKPSPVIIHYENRKETTAQLTIQQPTQSSGEGLETEKNMPSSLKLRKLGKQASVLPSATFYARSSSSGTVSTQSSDGGVPLSGASSIGRGSDGSAYHRRPSISSFPPSKKKLSNDKYQ